MYSFSLLFFYTEYLDGIAKPLKKYSPWCSSAVQSAFTDLSEKLKTTEGQSYIDQHFT